MHTSPTTSRREFLLAAAIGALGVAGRYRPASGHAGHRSAAGSGHPDPRPGIDGSNVLTADRLQDAPDLIPVYDGIRTIPHIADGVRCSCGCASDAGMRSLLSCFEQSGMAKGCIICQTEGRMVVRLHNRGRSLHQIRAAIDARFG